jgi:hypothetical protein
LSVHRTRHALSCPGTIRRLLDLGAPLAQKQIDSLVALLFVVVLRWHEHGRCGSPARLTAAPRRPIGHRVGRQAIAVHRSACAAVVFGRRPSFGNQQARLANRNLDDVADTSA